MEYAIVVRGRLTGRFTALFDGLRITPVGTTTRLVGDVVDQAQLHGILDRIQELGLELVSVEACPSPERAAGET